MILLAAYLALAPADSLVVSATWLRQHLADPHLVVLETDMTDAAYRKGHIPGARFVSMMAFHDHMDSGRYPSADSIVSVLQRLGIGNDDRVVIVGDPMSAAIAFVAFDYVGHGRRTAVLDGGRTGWRAAGGKVSQGTVAFGPASFRLSVNPNVLVDAGWVAAHRDSSRIRLLDARSDEEFRGTSTGEGLPRYGHIPGAHHLDWLQTLDSTDVAVALAAKDMAPDIRFAPSAKQRAAFARAGVERSQLIVTYCTVGMRASELYFTARRLGYAARIYHGSMADWSRRQELPMATGGDP